MIFCVKPLIGPQPISAPSGHVPSFLRPQQSIGSRNWAARCRTLHRPRRRFWNCLTGSDHLQPWQCWGRYFGFVVGGSLRGVGGKLAGRSLGSECHVQRQFSRRRQNRGNRHPLASGIVAPAADSAGALVTGAMMANFTALAAARHSVLRKHGWDVEADGLSVRPR